MFSEPEVTDGDAFQELKAFRETWTETQSWLRMKMYLKT